MRDKRATELALALMRLAKQSSHPETTRKIRDQLRAMLRPGEVLPETMEIDLADVGVDLTEYVAATNPYAELEENAFRLRESGFEKKLWGPWRNCVVPDETKHWQGVALLRSFLWSLGRDETALWRAREILLPVIRKFVATSDDLSWKRIHSWAVEGISGSAGLAESAKALILAKLAGASHPDDLTSDAIYTYIRLVVPPSLDALNVFLNYAQGKTDLLLELKLLRLLANRSHWINAQLAQLFDNAAQQKQHDLAWRALSILKARAALPEGAKSAWAISGENRSRYPFVAPNHRTIRACLAGFGDDEIKLTSSLFALSPQMVELLVPFNDALVVVKRKKTTLEPNEELVHAFLATLPWNVVEAKTIVLDRNAATAFGVGIPRFAKYVPADLWSILLVHLTHWFGIHAWDWKLSVLRNALASHKQANHSSQHGGVLERWSRDLNAEERSAYFQLTRLLPAFEDDERVASLQNRFLSRLTTAIYSHHAMALEALQHMRAPVELIWDLEDWIVSDAYSEIRTERKDHVRIPVPMGMNILP